MVPSGWNEAEMLNLLDKIIDYRGQSVPKAISGVPLITARNVKEGYLDFESQEFIDEESYSAWMTRGIPSKGDILFTTEAPLGNACRFPEFGKYAIGQRTVTLRVNPHLLNSDYLLYFILSERGQRLIDLRSSGSTAKGIKSSELKKVNVLYPESILEQEKIAHILSTWDQAIATTERLLDLARQQKKALMQQLLTGKKRFPGFEGEWKTVKLGSIFARVTTRNDGQSENVVTISGQQGLIRQDEYFNRTVASETLDNYFLLKKGQFAYNKSYSIGYPMGAIKRLNRYDDGVVTTLYICFELAAEGKADSNFFEHYFESGLLNRGLTQIAHEGGRAHGLLNVKPTDFFDLKVPLPALAEQVKIAATLTAADQEIETLQSQLDGLKHEKKALMQALLTGKRRVKVT